MLPLAAEIVHTDIRFRADNEELVGTFVRCRKIPKRGPVLYLHGAGSGNRQRFFYLADHLAAQGHDGFCFDFSGQGESTGAMKESSLKRRMLQSLSAIELMDIKSSLTVVGSSMGGFIAANLASHPSVGTLVLMSPALYDAGAFEQPFDESFTKMLRRPGSFKDTDILPKLAAFQGSVLLIIGSEDNVIPGEVITLYRGAFPNAARMEYAELKDAPHAIGIWAVQTNENSEAIFNIIDTFLCSD